MNIFSKAFLLVSLAFITSAVNAQIDITHIKTDGYDAYSVSSVNDTDSTFNLKISFSLEGDVTDDEIKKIFFNQIDSIMYSKYGDKYDSQAQKEFHEKMFKEMKKQDKESARKNKKLNRKLKKALKKEVKILKH